MSGYDLAGAFKSTQENFSEAAKGIQHAIGQFQEAIGKILHADPNATSFEAEQFISILEQAQIDANSIHQRIKSAIEISEAYVPIG